MVDWIHRINIEQNIHYKPNKKNIIYAGYTLNSQHQILKRTSVPWTQDVKISGFSGRPEPVRAYCVDFPARREERGRGIEALHWTGELGITERSDTLQHILTVFLKLDITGMKSKRFNGAFETFYDSKNNRYCFEQ